MHVGAASNQGFQDLLATAAAHRTHKWWLVPNTREETDGHKHGGVVLCNHL